MDADVIVVGAGLAGLVAAAELADAGRRVIAARPGAGAEPRRPGVLVASAGCSSSTRPEQRRMGIKDSLRARAGRTGWARAGVRPRRGPLAARSGRRPTSTSPPARSAPGCTAWAYRLFPVVGWAERGDGTRRRARQLGAALPHHLGHRPGRGRAVRAPGARGASTRGLVELRFRHRVDELVDDRRRGRPGCAARCSSPATSQRGAAELPRRGRRVRARARRRSSSPPAASAATTTWSARAWPERLGTPPRTHDRRACPPTSTAGCSAITEAAGGRVDQPRPDVALRRGHPQLGPGLAAATASASCPARRRCGSTRSASGCPRRSSPASTPSARCDHLRRTGLRPLLVRAHPEDHREGVRALRLRAEPRPDRQEPAARCSAAAAARARPRRSQAFLDHGEDFVVARHARRAGRGDERADRRAPARPGDGRARRSSPATGEIDNPFTKDPQIAAIRGARALPRRPADPGRRGRTGCSTRRPAR